VVVWIELHACICLSGLGGRLGWLGLMGRFQSLGICAAELCWVTYGIF
jgi:hypothetical protein